MPNVRIVQNAEKLAATAAEEIVRHAEAACKAGGRFVMALAGGETPKRTYELLADPKYRDRIDWTQAYFFLGDERAVAPEHQGSNYRLAYDSFLAKVPIPAGHVMKFWSGGWDEASAASSYEDMMRRFFRLDDDAIPRFDLVLLGLGADGHTASLFPGTPLVEGTTKRLAEAVWVPSLASYRFTLTPPVLNNAASVIFLVSGADKAEAVHRVLESKRQPERFPAQLVKPKDGELLWLIDRPAASALRKYS